MLRRACGVKDFLDAHVEIPCRLEEELANASCSEGHGMCVYAGFCMFCRSPAAHVHLSSCHRRQNQESKIVIFIDCRARDFGVMLVAFGIQAVVAVGLAHRAVRCTPFLSR